jgi:hypothetical protein
MLTLCGLNPLNRPMISFCHWEVSPNVMNCVEVGFDRCRRLGSVGVNFGLLLFNHWPVPTNLLVTRLKHHVCALNLVSAVFLTLDHMRGTLFQLTLDLHPIFILLSNVLRLVSSVMHISCNYCTVHVFRFVTGTLVSLLHLHTLH